MIFPFGVIITAVSVGYLTAAGYGFLVLGIGFLAMGLVEYLSGFR